ncbi:MAG TPA: hypothetical protein VNA66_00125 [Gammaproteobacteria bacterium]|nr:hypothetical protein [Gammaproteobacteria bacterium]
MRHSCIVLLTLLASPPAFAECTANVLGIGGSESAMEVSSDERRELAQLLGTQLDDVACSKMRRLGASGFIVKRGFFVLTMDEAVFVSDRKVKEILFRTPYRPVGNTYRLGHGSAVDHTLFVDITTGAERFRFELTCDAVGRRVADELARRIPAPTAVAASPSASPGGPQHSCD